MSKEAEQKPINPIIKLEQDVLEFWDKAKIFEKSVKNPPTPPLSGGQGVKDYVFYDGPPFATGLPHHGHIVTSLMKDVVPRYWTMNGYRVERKWGWDCHGLPIENIAEKELGFKRKKDIIDYGIDKFNEFCRSKVLGYVEDWQVVIRRLGRWADMESSYKTMDLPFMESVWWVFKQLWDKGLIYESYRSIHICPRCETTLSQQEVTEGYKEGIKDLSVVVKFQIANPHELDANLANENKVYVLAWTTTPWTLIANTALAVGEEIDYVKIKYDGPRWESSGGVKGQKTERSIIDRGIYILAKDIVWKDSNSKGLVSDLISSISYNKNLENDLVNSFREVRKKYGDLEGIQRDNKAKEYFFEKYSEKYGFEIIKGRDLVGKKYKPLFNYYTTQTNTDNSQHKSAFSLQESVSRGWKIYAADFVSTEDGTGIVHIAPAFGEDDLNLGKEENLPFVQHLGMDGIIRPEVIDFAGLSVKPADDAQATDRKIIDYLDKHNLLFSQEQYVHNYPHCWRCETPLLNYVTTSWFVNVFKIKERAIELAKDINWSPAHIKEGRWGKWLEGARDWSISRQRYWASVMPIWRCQGSEVKSEKLKVQSRNQNLKACGNTIVVGSVAELEQLSGKKIVDLHKHIVDKIAFPCEKCGGTMKRVPDVLDTWFDSGSMPYAQMHYPFENREKFEANFPAEFIAEGTDQTRAWFYYLHFLAVAIKDKPAFKNVIVNGIVLAEDGKKMSKRLKNYTDPAELFERFGADAVRYYLLSSAVMMADDLNFSDKGVEEALRKNIIILWNVYKFYEMYAGTQPPRPSGTPPLKGRDEGEVNVLDRWILARLNQLIAEVTKQMDAYDLPRSVRPISDFINDSSTWYLRRSRERFKSEPPSPLEGEGRGEVGSDKEAALATTKYVLIELSKVMAPFMPFMAESLWQRTTGNNFQDENKSVHLEIWPLGGEVDEKLLTEMELVRKIVEAGLAARDVAGIKVRQPLKKLKVKSKKLKVKEVYIEIIKEELNVREVETIEGGEELKMELDTELTEELKQDGVKREIIRYVNALRKNAGLTIEDRVIIYWQAVEMSRLKVGTSLQRAFTDMTDEIKKGTLSDEITNKKSSNVDAGKEVKVNGETVWLGIKKV